MKLNKIDENSDLFEHKNKIRTNFIILVEIWDQKDILTDEGLTPPKDGGTCLRRLSMFRKEVQ